MGELTFIWVLWTRREFAWTGTSGEIYEKSASVTAAAARVRGLGVQLRSVSYLIH